MVEESGENPNRADSDDDMNFSDEEGGLKVDGIYIPPPPEPYCSVETKGPRLIITKITNNFFKSYADNQVLGPFHKCFNAIVGPNGSGKSNVIDSMLFVFGYRASKIRSKKLSVLIHNSENFKNVQSCTVSIHFAKIIDKPGEDFEIVPGSEFVVARTANKDNSSYYTLNGRKAHFKEVGVLLKQSGIDLDHNRFLILQGEVEQIAMMNAKGTANEPGMLEYLEDIIGTSRYKIPLEQLNERVEQLSDERMEKLNRVRLIEGELSQLKAPMETAVQFLKQENTIAMKKNILYQKQIVDLGVKQKSLEEKKLESEEGQKEVTEKLAAVVAEKAEKSEKLRGYSTKYDDLTKRKDALKEALDKAEKKDAELQADMVRTNTNRKKTKELLTSEEQKLKDLMKNPEEMDVKIGALERKAEDALQKKAKFEEEKVKLINSLKDSTKDIQAKKEVVETKLLDLNRTVNETKYSYNLAESELKVCLSNEEKESKRLADIKKSLETDRESLETHTKEVEKLKQLIPQRESQLKKIQQELTRVRNEEDAIIPEIRRKRSMLEEKKSSMNASRSRGRVLDSLMQQKREGRCPGLFGRLGDLGAIDAKYDVAVSTACGPLDNIVVDTADTARWCIQFLKDHNVGRATIIVLEKQEHLRRYYERKLNTPENVPRLFDLIRVEDDRITPAFYYALRDTLVARDLEQGSRIAYGAQRYRVVTLKGDLIETSGTMSGGGKQVSRGRMGQSVAVSNVDPRELEDMEVSVGQLEQSCRELRQRRSDLETEMNSLTRELTQMKIAYEKYNVELQSLNGRKNNLLAQLRAQEVKAKNTKADPAKVKNLTKTVSEKKTAFEQAKAKADVLQAKVDEFTREIEAMTTGKLLAVDKNIKETNKAAEKFKTEITKLRVSVKTAERNAKQSTDRIAIMKQDIETAEKRLRAMKEQRDEIESDAHKLVTCIEEISETLNEKQEDFSGLKKEVDSLTKTENSLKAEKIEVDQISKEINEQIHELKKKSKQWQLMINELKLNKLPDDNNAPVLKVFEPNELMERDVTAVQRELKALEDEMKKHSVPNLNAIKEYATRREVYVKRSAELEETTEKRKKMRGYYDGLHGRRKEEFTTGFNIIRMKLREMYQMITLGGDADFEMLDTFDPFTEGIQFKVRPPKKTWKLISNLSGGEKTLSSLALVFALHYYKPSPLYFMDEIDAALDFKNVSIIGNYIREKTKNAQFIIISLRSNMFELSDYLIGIYKTDNTTKSLTIDPRTEDQKRKPEDYNKPAKAVQFSSSQATVNKTTSTVFGTQPNTIVDSVVSAVSVAESAMDVESSGGVSNGTDRNIEDMEISDTGVDTLNN